jgi:hypothetical protein
MNNLKFLFLACSILLLASCATMNKSMREPNVRVQLEKSDFTLSGQVSAEASTTKILSIDFNRLFNKKTGTIEGSQTISLASIPVVGTVLGDKTANYALYDLMNANSGYDVIFYPQYETRISRPFLGLGFIYKKITVKATARLGKLNN